MARFEAKSIGLGVLQNLVGDVLPGQVFTLTGGPLYAAETGGTTLSGGSLVFGSSPPNQGKLPGWFDPDTDAGVYTLTVAGQAIKFSVGEAGRVKTANLPVFLVENYVPITASDKLAADAALTAATASTRGGVVQFGARNYALADWAPVLPSGTAKAVHIKGAGKLQTTLTFSTDRGAGTWAIRSDSDAAAGGVCYSVISDAWIVGPSTTVVLGASPAAMRGIRQTRRMTCERLVISGFHMGTQIAGDHTTTRDVNCSQNKYGLGFAEMGALFGDTTIDNCDLTGNTMASWWIANNALASATVVGGHMGFSPYCIEVEAGSAAALSLGGTTFTRTSFEAAGNGWIYSSDKSVRVDGVDWIGCGFTRSATYKLPANNANYGIYVNQWWHIRMHGCTLRDAWDLGQINAVSVATFDMDRAQASWDAAATAVVPFLTASSGIATRVNISTDTWKARGAIANGTVVKGQLLGRMAGFFYPFASGNVVLEGVALNDATAANLTVAMACYEGDNIYTLTKAAVTLGQALVVNSTDRNKVSGETDTGAPLTRQRVGHTYSGLGGVDSNLQASVRVTR